MSKRQSKTRRNQGSQNQLAASDQELIAKALNLALKTLHKRKDKLSDQDRLLFMTKLGPYGWTEDLATNDNDDNKNSAEVPGSNNADNASGTSKRKAENGRTKGARKQLSTNEQYTITKALRSIVNTLCKRIDRLCAKDLILFSAILARYKCIPGPDSENSGVEYISIGTGA